MAWYDAIVSPIAGFFETARSIPERLEYHPPEPDVEGAIAALDPYEYGSGWGVTYGAPWGVIFNPSEVGIAPLDKNRAESAQEIALQEGEPAVTSSLLDVLYGGMVKACYEDQYHRHCNPNAAQACQDLADRNDYSGLILIPKQRDLLGITPPADQASDIVLQYENDPEGTFTVSPDNIPRPPGNFMSNFIMGVKSGYNLEKVPGYIREDKRGQVGEPDNRNVFQESLDKWGSMIPNIGKMPSYTGYLIIGGAFLLLILLVRR